MAFDATTKGKKKMVVLGKKNACQTEEHTSVLLCVCVQRKHFKVEHCCGEEHAKVHVACLQITVIMEVWFSPMCKLSMPLMVLSAE